MRCLPTVESLKIPRCYIISNPKPDSEKQLHVFVDASENGFAAVAYLRTTNNELVDCALIGAKTRVSPLKTLSIPRLELQAAVLGARLSRCIVKSHTINLSHRFFWSDSKTVLSWLRSDHRRYRQFVAHRVSEILDLTMVSEWRWIPTKLNVADEGTKWQKLPDLDASSRWFRGPEFLNSPPDKWPQEVQPKEFTMEELKTQFINVHTQAQENVFQFKDTSSWKRLLRSTAFVFRFIHNIKLRNSEGARTVGPLLKEELQLAENALVREAQADVYQEEIAYLTANRFVERSSPLVSLCPYLDDHKIIRANGRIHSLKEARFQATYNSSTSTSDYESNYNALSLSIQTS